MFLALFRHQMLRRLRQPRPHLFWLSAVLVGLLLIYAMVGLVLLALGAEVLLYQWQPGVGAVGFVNAHLPEVAFSLLLLRFFMQRTPEGSLTPYLHLPIGRGTLARFFAVSSMLSLHNLLPLFFAVPFALRSVAAHGGMRGALVWFGGVVALLAASDLTNTLLRSMLGRRGWRSVLLLCAAALFVAFDALFGGGWLRLGGWLLFSALAEGGITPLLACWTLVAVLFVSTTAYLAQRLRAPEATRSAGRLAPRFDPRQPHRSLIQLEVALILRNARPRQFVVISLLFSSAYLLLFLSQGSGGPPTVTASIGALLLGYMVSGMFALNYGPLMFGWESAFFDGLLARPMETAPFVRSKLMLLQGSCVLLALVALPFFVWLAPGFTPHLAASALYNAGFSVPVVLWLALGNRTRLDLDRTSVFNFQGVSARHVLWTVLLALPPSAMVLVWRDAGLVALSAAGVVAAAISLAWPVPFITRLLRSRHQMAAAFRSSVA